MRLPLIVDPDPAFLESMKPESYAAISQPKLAATGKEAQAILADSKIRISAVFVNPAISKPGGISVIRCAHLHRPTLPVFVIHEGSPPFNETEMKGLGIREMIQKPVTFAQLNERCGSTALVFDSKRFSGDLKPDLSQPVDSEQSIEDSKFIPIRAEDFMGGSKSFFDLYVRLNPHKYLKLLQAGDVFQPERLKTYISKGVVCFYLKKEAQQHYLAYCDKIASSLLKTSKVSNSTVTSQVLNQGEETIKFFQTQGISEVKLQYASNFIKNTLELVNRLEPGKHRILKGFLDDLTSYDHGIGVTIIASLLFPALDVVSAAPVETIGFACLFHDIALPGLGLREEDELKMSKEEYKKYITHPTLGAEMLETIKSINPSVIQAVAQHHERRNKKGFPNQLGPGTISLVAEIVGISDEFLKIIHRIKSDEKFDLQDELRTNIFDCFSSKVVSAFKSVFFFMEQT